jgi:hypothetical protein
MNMEVRPCVDFPSIGHELVWTGADVEAGGVLCYIEGEYKMRRGRRSDGGSSISRTIGGKQCYLIVDRSCPAVAANDPTYGAPGLDISIEENCEIMWDEGLTPIHHQCVSLCVKQGCTVRTGDVLWNAYGDQYWRTWTPDQPERRILPEHGVDGAAAKSAPASDPEDSDRSVLSDDEEDFGLPVEEEHVDTQSGDEAVNETDKAAEGAKALGLLNVSDDESDDEGDDEADDDGDDEDEDDAGTVNKRTNKKKTPTTETSSGDGIGEPAKKKQKGGS